MSKRLTPGITYDWLVTASVGDSWQDHWGYVVGRGRTEDDELSEIRVGVAAKMLAPISSLVIRSVVFTERR